MSHEALHNTKIEHEKQKKDMNDVDSSISKLQKSRNEDQKILNTKRSKKIELETKITKNIQDQKKPDADKSLLILQKTQLENELIEIDRDIPIYISIVEDYDTKIQKLKKSKDTIEPKLSSAKKESLAERVAHFSKKYWKHALAGVFASTILYGGYRLGKNDSSDGKEKGKNNTEQTGVKKDSTTKNQEVNNNTVNNNTYYYDGGQNKNSKDLSDKNESNKNRSNKNKETVKKGPKITYELTNPDGTKKKTFNTREERNIFAREHNLIVHEDSNNYDKEQSQEKKIEWKLTSPDGKQTKTFNTREERNAFAREHNLIIHEN